MMIEVRSTTRMAARHLFVAATAAVLALGFAFDADAQAPAQPRPAQPRPAQPAAPKPPAGQTGQQAQPQGQQAQPAAPDAAQQKALPAIATPWTKICGQDPQVKKDICLVTQEMRAETGQFLASVAVREVQDDPKKVFIVGVPVGMKLRPGLRVVIDQQPPINAQYDVCFPNACYSFLDINADMVTKMKKGQALTILTLNQAERQVPFTMALEGFGKAYDGPALDPKAVEEQRNKLQDEMQKRAEELRKKLTEQGQGGAPAAAAPK